MDSQSDVHRICLIAISKAAFRTYNSRNAMSPPVKALLGVHHPQTYTRYYTNKEARFTVGIGRRADVGGPRRDKAEYTGQMGGQDERNDRGRRGQAHGSGQSQVRRFYAGGRPWRKR
ncbi:hypothetical protein PV04_09642 [Phialophora macrospora]|uniref:Uncharacterized protein n=1 Tax=Phialophora macrospora TaxID=1851006 RepID=A0A0D2F9N5_9EURO|nr:hypothetical protein PV04_09642 [Phialophora macrospora]